MTEKPKFPKCEEYGCDGKFYERLEQALTRAENKGKLAGSFLSTDKNLGKNDEITEVLDKFAQKMVGYKTTWNAYCGANPEKDMVVLASLAYSEGENKGKLAGFKAVLDAVESEEIMTTMLSERAIKSWLKSQLSRSEKGDVRNSGTKSDIRHTEEPKRHEPDGITARPRNPEPSATTPKDFDGIIHLDGEASEKLRAIFRKKLAKKKGGQKWTSKQRL